MTHYHLIYRRRGDTYSAPTWHAHMRVRGAHYLRHTASCGASISHGYANTFRRKFERIPILGSRRFSQLARPIAMRSESVLTTATYKHGPLLRTLRTFAPMVWQRERMHSVERKNPNSAYVERGVKKERQYLSSLFLHFACTRRRLIRALEWL